MANHNEDFLRLANAAREQITEVKPQEVDALVESGAALVDVRDKEEFERGHIPGATHISRGTLEMQASEAMPDKSAPIVCYCAGGSRGALAAHTLQQMGYRNVVSIEGGLNAYIKASQARGR